MTCGVKTHDILVIFFRNAFYMWSRLSYHCKNVYVSALPSLCSHKKKQYRQGYNYIWHSVSISTLS